ncbi:hypothetical protein ACTXT7_002621 [Hymenolepis weldensis]
MGPDLEFTMFGFTKLQRLMKRTRRNVHKSLTDIKKKVKEFQHSVDGRRISDFKSVKRAVITAEKSFTEYYEYERQSMENLIKSESKLCEELSIFCDKIDRWDKDSAYETNKVGAQKSSNHFGSSNSGNMLPEVHEFQDFLLKNGGRTGGWTDFNHQTFLKIRRRYLSPNLKQISSVPVDLMDQFLQEVTSALCLNSSEEGLSHEEWFVKLNKLEESSKNALKEYKLSHKKVLSVEEAEVRVRPKLNSGKSLNRAHQRAQIIAWREAKQRELNQKLEEERQKVEERKRIEETKRQEHVKELKARIEEYRLRKETLSEVKDGAQKIHERIMNSAKKTLTELDRNRISERNNHLIQLQTKRKLAKYRELEERQERINRANSKYRVQVKRDPDRAMGFTELWNLRIQAQKEEKDQPSHIQPPGIRILSDRPQKAVPEWRRRISTS